MKLIAKGKILKNDDKISEYKLENDSVLHLIVNKPANQNNDNTNNNNTNSNTNGNPNPNTNNNTNNNP